MIGSHPKTHYKNSVLAVLLPGNTSSTKASASNAVTLTVTSVTAISVSIASKSNIRIQAKYVSASGVDTVADHGNDKIGIAASTMNALTVR